MLGLLSTPVIRSTSVVPYAEGCSNSWTICEKAPPGDAEPPSASPHAIMIAPARRFSCLLMPSSRIFAQSNPAGTSGSMEAGTNLYFACACAEDAPKPSSARKTPARITTKPIKTRGLKNPASPQARQAGADCEVDFFFIVEFHWSARLLVETIRTINRFYLCTWT